MKFKLSIAARLIIGFGILTLALIVNGVFIGITLSKSEKVNTEIKNLYTPSEENIHQLASLVEESRMLVRSWVFIDKKPETPDKINLVKIHEEEFPKVDSSLTVLSEQWGNDTIRDEYFNIATTIRDTLFPRHQYIMGLLNSFESYDDPLTIFEVVPMVEEGGEIMILTDSIINRLNVIVAHHENNIEDARMEMENSLKTFNSIIRYSLFILFFFAVSIGYITTRSLRRPINRIKNIKLHCYSD